MRGVFVTGIGGGIGAGIAEAFERNGWLIAGSDTKPIDRPGWHTFVGDVTDEQQVRSWFDSMTAEEFPLTSLVNTAGINYHARIDECDLEAWQRMFDVNVLGMVRCIKYAAPLLRRSSGATIVNMSSISGRIGSDGYAAYVATKAAVDGLTRSLALELAPDIRVNAVAPGWIDAGFTTEGIARHPDPKAYLEEVFDMHALGRIGSPEEVGEAVLWLAGEKSSFVVGAVVDIDGGYLIKN